VSISWLLAIALAFVAPFAGITGLSWLLGVLLIFGLSRIPEIGRLRLKPIFYALPILSLLAGWFIGSLLYSVPYAQLQSAGYSGIVKLLLLWSSDAGPEGFIYLRLLLVSLCLILLFDYIQAQPARIRGMLLSLIAGATVACLYSFLRLATLFSSQSDFWVGLGRHSATFYDPNALGVGAFLILGSIAYLIIGTRDLRARILLVLLGTGWFCLGLLSGSRTFALGLVIATLVFGLYRRPGVGLALVAAISLSLLTCNLIPAESFASLAGNLPASLERVAFSVRFDLLGESFTSRAVFWQVGLSMLSEIPMSGIGPDNYRNWFPTYAGILQLDTNLWTDSANSLYLQILIELGSVGALLVLLAATYLSPSDHHPLVLRQLVLALIISFIVISALGSHIESLQVAVLFTIVLGAGFRVRSSPNFTSSVLVLALSFTAMLYACINYSDSSYGLYLWERDGDGVYRWTSESFQFFVDCGDSTEPSPALRAVHSTELEIEIDRARLLVVLNPGESYRPDALCDPEEHSVRARVRGKVSPSLLPALSIESSSDSRVLGVQIRDLSPMQMRPSG